MSIYNCLIDYPLTICVRGFIGVTKLLCIKKAVSGCIIYICGSIIYICGLSYTFVVVLYTFVVVLYTSVVVLYASVVVLYTSVVLLYTSVTEKWCTQNFKLNFSVKEITSFVHNHFKIYCPFSSHRTYEICVTQYFIFP